MQDTELSKTLLNHARVCEILGPEKSRDATSLCYMSREAPKNFACGAPVACGAGFACQFIL